MLPVFPGAKEKCMFHLSKNMRPRLLLAAGLVAMAAPFAARILAQQAAPAAPAARQPNQPTDARLQGFRWRSIGPTG
ncbi:MAG: hypothetical protein ABIP90_09900, partial [Vicinamibacterales bacterium]